MRPINNVAKSVLISSVMILLVAVALSGCLDTGGPQPGPTQPGQTPSGGGGQVGPSGGPLTVKITSPKDTQIYKRGQELTFDATISGGVPPYRIRWYSSLNGNLSNTNPFKNSSLLLGSHGIGIEVTDSTGTKVKNEIRIDVI
ncbi:MAG TPA: hypothetical protein HA257_00955 [Candidatus Methanoperedenaceae archaeon]|nr:hypothetical protein [Candidatus Methanoperedenaceae archaeon]